MTGKEKALLVAMNKPDCLLVFEPSDIKAPGLNIHQVSGLFSIFERKGLIRRARFSDFLWILTEEGKGAL